MHVGASRVDTSVRVDTRHPRAHAAGVRAITRRIVALVLMAALAVVGGGLQAATLAAPAAPMPCCHESADCAMPAMAPERVHPTTALAQPMLAHAMLALPADCCAVAPAGAPAPQATASTVVAPSDQSVTPTELPAFFAPLRTTRPPLVAAPPGAHVARHLLLTVVRL